MAIGSAPPIGEKFGGGFERDEDGFLTYESMKLFYADWRDRVGPDLVGGWAKLIRSDRSEQQQLKRPGAARYKGEIPQTQVPLSCLYTTVEREHASNADVAVHPSRESNRS